MRVIIHADDLGLTENITNDIFDCYDYGVLHRVSLVPNGQAFEKAVEGLRRRPGLRWTIHLNLVEGRAISDPDKIPLLVDKNGWFNNSFQKFFFRYLFFPKRARMDLTRQIRWEIKSQIDLVRRFLPLASTESFSLDSHQHVHMIPFIFETVLGFRRNYPIGEIRVTSEPLFWGIEESKDFARCLGPNLVKNRLLSFLANNGKVKSHRANLICPDYLLGILFSGDHHSKALHSGLEVIQRKNPTARVEAIFHPGKAQDRERGFWGQSIIPPAFYFHPNRSREKELLLRGIEQAGKPRPMRNSKDQTRVPFAFSRGFP